MNNKEKYRELCKKENSIPLFSNDWWLDATAGENNWDVALIEKGGEITATFPYVVSKKIIFKLINMPKLTPYLGIWIKYPSGQKYATKLSFEKEIANELIKMLPSFDYFLQRFHPNISDWLPFHWNKFEQTTRYTYILKDLSDTEKVFSELKENIRRDIRKAERVVKIEERDDINLFYEINKLTYKRQNKNIPRSFDYVRKIDNACKERDRRKILIAIDESKNIHAASYIVWDKNCCYYLMGGFDPAFKNSEATKLLIWEAIKHAGKLNLFFDFEGSMIEPIEKLFRSFGGTQTPFFQITKINSLLLKLREFLLKLK